MSKKYSIDKDAHYFVLMHPLERFGPIVFKSNMRREKWVECVVVEENYKVDDDYKIELRSIEEGYGKETFYQEDFISFLNSNIKIVKKDTDDMVCTEETWIEPLCGDVFLRHSAYTLTKNNDLDKGKTLKKIRK